MDMDEQGQMTTGGPSDEGESLSCPPSSCIGHRATPGRGEGRAGLWGRYGAGKGAELGSTWDRQAWRMLQWCLTGGVTVGGLTSRRSLSCRLPPWRSKRRRKKEAVSAVMRKRFREHRIGLGQQAEACRGRGKSGQGTAEENHHPLTRAGRHLDTPWGDPSAQSTQGCAPSMSPLGRWGGTPQLRQEKLKKNSGTKSTSPALPAPPAALQHPHSSPGAGGRRR